MALVYYKGQELPDAWITWLDSVGTVVNFASGFTFTVKIGTPGSAALLTKTSGITGGSTDPNIIISWNNDDLASLTPGTYNMDIIARRSSDTKDRIQTTTITINNVVT